MNVQNVIISGNKNMNNCIDLLNKLEKKHKEIAKKINTNKSIILKLANKIKKTYKNYLNIIFSEELPLQFFDFKTNDKDIGDCGTLNLCIKTNKFLISSARHMIRFCKYGVFIDIDGPFKGTLKTVSLSEDEIVKIIKTLNFMLENKLMIFESLEKYISETLSNKITNYSKKINTLEEKLNFIENIKNNF